MQTIKVHIKTVHSLAKKALPLLTNETNNINHTQSQDITRIETCLDHLLDFAFHTETLFLFKELCRYYITITPVASKQYVYFYKEMYDEK
jgi:ABC-type transporter MlaC component